VIIPHFRREPVDGFIFSMASIPRLPLVIGDGDPWERMAKTAQGWARERGVEIRDAIVLVPFAQHLPLARRAWVQSPGWMPRIETTMTLARSLGPGTPFEAGQISFDTPLDRLVARGLLRGQPFGQALQRRDERGFDHAVGAIVETAHAFALASAAMTPADREGYWTRGRESLAIAAGPGGTERMLARIAFEWAAASAEPVTDVLFDLRPSAWIAVQSGGPDLFVQNLLSRWQHVPALIIDADASPDAVFAEHAPHADVAFAVCADFEAEAQRCAAEVLANLSAGRQPVALISQDRLLMRRVRALLARQHVDIVDETGWKLSTTRAGATIGTLLRAAHARASADDWLDWLKSCTASWPGMSDAAWSVQVIESAMRRRAWTSPSSVDVARLGERATALWQAAQAVIADLRSPRSRSFAAWIAALARALEFCGAWAQMQSDDAGRQALAALHLVEGRFDSSDRAEGMTLQEFTSWVDGTLEDAPFKPEAGFAAVDAPVVVTPLAQVMLRPFAAVVFPGADEKRLGGSPQPHSLLSDAQATELGLPGVTAKRDAELLAFAQLLRIPHISLLRRSDDGGEPLAPSTLVERLRIAMRAAGRDLPAAADPLGRIELAARPIHRPAPIAPDLVPSTLSASACEALRVCPYRFFVLRLLALRDADELDDEVEKRDYGTWLHEVLHRFHLTRTEPLSPTDEEARLHVVADEVQQTMGLDEASFLPFAATFARFAPRYVSWLHERDAAGAQWLEGERDLRARPEAWAGVEMQGRIDRIDSVPGDDGPVTQLIDYKTGSAQNLRNLVKRPQEDTQLAFYAALMAEQSEAGGAVGAIYLPLDDNDGIKAIEHKDVEATARALVIGIGRDLDRLRDGAVLPALGDGIACEYCEARGLCRRDHWAALDES